MADRVGHHLGNYHLSRLLGEGGFADVYLGEHVYLKTWAAIKVLRTRLGQDDLEGFLGEAQTIARLKHPHIVRVLDFGVEEGTPFLVMEYASQGTLRQRHPKGQMLALAVIRPYMRQVAEALQYAHERKLIHRDVKPENMLLSESDEVLLSDFGIATMAHSSRYQSTQDVGGTLAYMAPEQIQGHPRPASDQYALGVVIYEWLAGTLPFLGSMNEVVAQQLSTPPPPLRQKLPDLSPDLEGVVLTALEKDPRERFASIRAFATAFENACQTAGAFMTPSLRVLLPPLPLIFEEPSLPPSSPAAGPFPPTPADASSLANAPASDSTPVAVETVSPAPDPAMTPQSAVNPFVEPLIIPELSALPSETSPERDRIPTSPDRPVARSAAAAPVSEGPPFPLTPPEPVAIPTPPQGPWRISRRTAIIGLTGLVVVGVGGGVLVFTQQQGLSTSLTKKWQFPTGGIAYTAPAVANGEVYIGSRDSTVYALDAASGRKQWAFHTKGSIDYSTPAVANGVVYVGSSDGNLYALDAASGTEQWAFHTGGEEVYSPAVANGVVYVGSLNGLYALDATSGGKLWAFEPGAAAEMLGVVNGVVYVGTDELYALDATSGTRKWSYPAVGDFYLPQAMGGDVIYAGSFDGSLYALDVAFGTKQWAFHTGGQIDSAPAVANGLVYVGSEDHNLYALDATDGTQQWAYQTGDAIKSTPAVANSVVYVGSTDGTLYALDAVSGTEKGSYVTGGAINSSPTVVNGVVCIGSTDGNLYALYLL